MFIQQRQDIEQVKQDAETKRVLIKETNKAHQMELQDQAEYVNAKMKTDTQAQDTVMETQTRLEIEHIKGQFALILAKLSKESLKNASAETTERAI